MANKIEIHGTITHEVTFIVEVPDKIESDSEAEFSFAEDQLKNITMNYCEEIEYNDSQVWDVNTA